MFGKYKGRTFADDTTVFASSNDVESLYEKSKFRPEKLN